MQPTTNSLFRNPDIHTAPTLFLSSLTPTLGFNHCRAMKLSASIWACIIVLFIAGWRSIQLYRSSTAVLSPNASVDATPLQSEIHPPRRYRKDIDEDDIMNDKPAKLFYFVQVQECL